MEDKIITKETMKKADSKEISKFTMEIAGMVKEMRLAMGMDLIQFAKALRKSSRLVWAWENGSRQVKFLDFKKITVLAGRKLIIEVPFTPEKLESMKQEKMKEIEELDAQLGK